MKSMKDTKGQDTVISRMGASRKVDLLVGEESLYPYGKIWEKNHIACVLVDEAEFFKGSETLMRWADHIEELINICGEKGCGQKAKFQGRKVEGSFVLEGEEILIDGSCKKVEYVPLCGEHYLKNVYDKKIEV